MARIHLIALVFGVCLLAQPFTGTKFAFAEEDDYADEAEADDESAPAEATEGDVVVLTASNFDSLIKEHKYVLAEFYAPWCGHCKTLAPEYAKAATTLKAHDANIVIGKVDATVETELAERFGVSGYPTLKWFVNGEPTEYGGGRDEDGIVKWVVKKTGPAAVKADSAADLKTSEEASEVIVVGYFSKLEGAEYDAFIAVAEGTDSVSFVETTTAAVGKAVGLSKPGVAIVKNFKGEAREVLQAPKVTKDALEEFIKAEKLPLTIEFNPDNSEKIFGAGIPRHILMLAKDADLKAGSAAMKAFRAVATALKGKFVFVTVAADKEESDPVVKFFELDKEKSPSIVGFQMEPKQKKFKFNKDLSEKDLKAFAESIFDGTLQPEYKSEDIPENDMDGEVKIVVGKTFEAIVKDPTKDVLLEVYAPWCGHCKTLAPIYKKLGKRFKDVSSVVIAKLDGTGNEHADLDVQGFPTLIFYPAEKGAAPVPYEGDRDLKGMTKFLKEHAKIPYELKKKGSKGDDSKEEDDSKDEL